MNEINAIKFCGCLFGYMRKNEMRKFEINKLEKFIQEQIRGNEDLFLLFLDINDRTVIKEGISFFQIVGGLNRNIFTNKPTAKILISLETANKLIDSVEEEYRQPIEKMVIDFKSSNKTIPKTKKLTRRN